MALCGSHWSSIDRLAEIMAASQKHKVHPAPIESGQTTIEIVNDSANLTHQFDEASFFAEALSQLRYVQDPSCSFNLNLLKILHTFTNLAPSSSNTHRTSACSSSWPCYLAPYFGKSSSNEMVLSF